MANYLFQVSKGFDVRRFETIFLEFDPNPIFTYMTPLKGMIETENDIDGILSLKAFEMHEKLNVSISFLKVPSKSELSLKLLSKCLSFYPNAFRYMSDIIFKELTFGDYSSIPYLHREFLSVPKEIMMTVGAYLREGMDGTKAAKSLYIHRNTFLFRIDKFIKLTNIDVRDYHYALLLELYFQLAAF